MNTNTKNQINYDTHQLFTILIITNYFLVHSWSILNGKAQKQHIIIMFFIFLIDVFQRK